VRFNVFIKNEDNFFAGIIKEEDVICL
jgi:hypothetical protein